MQSKVSMVMACYNKERYIGEMLDSVRAQVWDNIELILVNDGSTDGTRDIIISYIAKLEERGYEVKLIDQENQGVSCAIKTGLLAATGEYVCMPDCDDLIYPEYISVMAGWLDSHSEIEYAVCDLETVRKEHYSWVGVNAAFETFTKPTPTYQIENLLERWILLNLWGTAWNFVAKREFIILCGVPDLLNLPLGRFTQEPQVWLPILLSSKRGNGIYIPRVLYYYRGGTVGAVSPNISATARRKIEYAQAYKQLIDLVFEHFCKTTGHSLLLSTIRMYIELFGLSTLYYNDLSEILLKNKTIRYKIPLQIKPSQLNVFLHCLFAPQYRNALLGLLNGDGRIIVTAAKGVAARGCILRLYAMGINPVLWDEAATDNDEATKPDYDSVTEDDTVLIFTRKQEVANYIKAFVCDKTTKIISDRDKFEQIVESYNLYNRLAINGNQNKLKVSIVSPCFNKADYIESFVGSIVKQKYDNIEVVLVNDGSSDGTELIVNHCENILASRGFDVKIINQTNQGVAIAARNGLLACSGDIVCLPDCDDTLSPDFVSTLANWLGNHPEDDYVVCDLLRGRERWRWLNADSMTYDRPMPLSNIFKNPVERFILRNSHGAVWTMMVRREYLLQSGALECLEHLSSRTTHESQVWLPVFLGGGKGTYIPIPLYSWRIVLSSLSDKTSFQKAECYADNYCEQIRFALSLKGCNVNDYETIIQIRKDWELEDYGFFYFVSKTLLEKEIIIKPFISENITIQQVKRLLWFHFIPQIDKTMLTEQENKLYGEYFI